MNKKVQEVLNLIKEKGIKIFYSGENYVPDFNLVDYGISPYQVEFFDRHCRASDSIDLALEKKEYNFTLDVLKDKPYFANFIAGHESEYSLRGDFFKKLNQIKRVESCGKYLNNMPDGFIIKREDKLPFQSKCKFTLCFESTSHLDFCTEKLVDAFKANTIPVYFGAKNVEEYFNKDAFINVASYSSFDEVIEKIMQLDNDDEAYLKMLNTPAYLDEKIATKQYERVEKFIYNIFNQPIEKAKRRSTVYVPNVYNNLLGKHIPKAYEKTLPFKIRLKRAIKKIINKKNK